YRIDPEAGSTTLFGLTLRFKRRLSGCQFSRSPARYIRYTMRFAAAAMLCDPRAERVVHYAQQVAQITVFFVLTRGKAGVDGILTEEVASVDERRARRVEVLNPVFEGNDITVPAARQKLQGYVIIQELTEKCRQGLTGENLLLASLALRVRT